MSEKTSDEVRNMVSKAYAEALARSRAGGGGCCGDPKQAQRPAAACAGYTEEAERHADVASSSFGCGNPLAFAGVEPGQVVLDLGSGAGLDLLIAAEKVGPGGRVIGVDMTDEMIDQARTNMEREGATDIVELRRGLIEELPVEDSSVDWVISNCVINLSPEKDRVFKEIFRVLRPGGRFSISDIVVEDLPDWIREHAAAYTACVAGAIREEEYVDGLRGAGLADVEVADRFVYDDLQLKEQVVADMVDRGMDPETLERGIADVSGKVWSARFVGRKGP